jgi:U3 small nucleolar RNA-associated protein 23
MKVKRLKRAARVLTFFHYNFGYHPPHSILLDGTFCQAALQNKINLREQMPKYLAETPERVEMYVTECMLNELSKSLGNI